MEESSNLANRGPSFPENPLRKALAYDLVDGAISNPKCPICSSVYCKEVEEMYSEGRPERDIRAFLEEKGETVGIQQIKTHFKVHYNNLEKIALMVDYCDRIEDLMVRTKNRKEDLEYILQSSYVELNRVLSIDTKNIIDREKTRADLIMKIKQDIRLTIDTINSMEKQEDQVGAFKVRVVDAWKTIIEESSGSDRDILKAALIRFRNIMEESE